MTFSATLFVFRATAVMVRGTLPLGMLRDFSTGCSVICPWELNKNISPSLCVAVLKVSSTGDAKCLQLSARDNTILRTSSLVQNIPGTLGKF